MEIIQFSIDDLVKSANITEDQISWQGIANQIKIILEEDNKEVLVSYKNTSATYFKVGDKIKAKTNDELYLRKLLNS